MLLGHRGAIVAEPEGELANAAHVAAGRGLNPDLHVPLFVLEGTLLSAGAARQGVRHLVLAIEVLDEVLPSAVELFPDTAEVFRKTHHGAAENISYERLVLRRVGCKGLARHGRAAV